MGLRPDEARVDEADLVEPLELLEADREQLARLGLGDRPRLGRREEALAVFAEGERRWGAVGEGEDERKSQCMRGG